MVRHGSSRQLSAGAQRLEQLAPGGVIERVEVHRGVAFIAEHLDQGRPALFLGRLELPEDACSLAYLKDEVAKRGGDLRGLLGALAETDAFLYRQVTP